MDTAVLFLVFNRPETTRQVFEAIRQARPSRLYVAADGPRDGKPGERALCEKVREIVSNINWPCDVKKLFKDENLGCRIGVSSGISWFFEHEEEGIILEDDVIPSPDFFGFCEKLLEKYRHDERIMMITGTNFHPSDNTLQNYFYSQHFSIWGWATWRRAWQLYDINMSSWPSTSNISYLNYHFGTKIAKYFIYTFNLVVENKFNTWDIQWSYCCIFNNGLCVTPRVNLVSNIGVVGTHSDTITGSHMLPFGRLSSECLKGPSQFCVDVEYDLYLHKTMFIPVVKKSAQANFLRSIGLLGLVIKLRRCWITWIWNIKHTGAF